MPIEKAIENAQVIRFANFDVDLRSGELRKGGVKLKLSGQPFQVLVILPSRREVSILSLRMRPCP
jgi:DNA-binding response OmpR family regulator